MFSSHKARLAFNKENAGVIAFSENDDDDETPIVNNNHDEHPTISNFKTDNNSQSSDTVKNQPPVPPPRNRSMKSSATSSNVLGRLFEQIKEKDVQTPALHYPQAVKLNKMIYFTIGGIIFTLLFLWLELSQTILLITPCIIFVAIGKINLYPSNYLYGPKYSMTFHQLRESIRFYNRHITKELSKKKRNRVIALVDPTDIQLIPLVFALIQSGQEVIVLNPKECGLNSFFEWIPKLDIDAVLVSPLIYCIIQVIHFVKKRSWLSLGKKYLLFTSSLSAYKLISKNSFEWSHIPRISKVDQLQQDPISSDEDLFSYNDDDTVAIVNTTGTTGQPKLVHITHAMLKSQIESFGELMTPYLLKGRQDRIINHNIVMTLCVNCMGLTSIVPPFDLSKPSSVDPNEYINTIHTYNFYPRFGFCSPIVWMEIMEYCSRKNKPNTKVKEEYSISPPLEVLLCGGNSTPFSLHQKFRQWACKDEDSSALLFPAYGATECLPICLTNTWELEKIYQTEEIQHSITRGYCVGKECPNVTVLIRNQDKVSGGKVGEIWIGGKAVSPRYELDQTAMLQTKEMIDGVLFHKTGDIGYKDENDMVWYCGRLSHLFHAMPLANPNDRNKSQVEAPLVIIPACVEHAFYNKFPIIRRCACVGYSPITKQSNIMLKLNERNFLSRYNELSFNEMVIVFETFGNEKIDQSILKEFWNKTILSNPETPKEFSNLAIRFVQQKSLPVDNRHNSKIEMIRLALELNRSMISVK
ncbi:hypothetical protein C9374_009925 [Naegleria lovaniensis]|uniref:AMP-dependent synthetase/ligase domain-containing protein n=1 Tax=Naegleria lovaniensis TaxID=51637 RepID=A0AA88GD16_NAELO|nr:uncharacterized protein C9374_009925 [Naegleria lovaniensis]KAG2375302.1 hypothetical protein C9374_009925 [Naegleria lovaniensis]